jgi:fatty-acyl-CoA synthase/long-chain acyl-CoA synthetase
VLIGEGSVVDACVVGLPDDRWGEIVAVAIRTDGDVRDGLKADLTEYVGHRLAPFKVPARWFVTNELPVTPTGKVRKFEVRDSIADGRLREL